MVIKAEMAIALYCQQCGKLHINKISYSNLLNKAGRQTIEAFLEKNVWKIGVDNNKE